MEVKDKKGKVEVFEVDEHPRETTLDKLGKLPPVFKENGTVSAGNASVSLLMSIHHTCIDMCHLLGYM